MKHSIRARSIRTTRGRAIVLLAGVGAMLLTTALVASSPAGAAVQTRNFTISGSTTIGGTAQNFPPNSLVSLMIDDTTGDITGGTFSIPTYDVTSMGVTAHVTVGQAGQPTGNLDPDTGQMDLTVHTQTTLTIDALSSICTFGPFDIDLSTTNAGGADFTGDPLTGTLTAQNISIPTIATSATCAAPIASGISTVLGLPTTTASQIMTLAATDQAVTTTVPVTLPPTTSTTAAPAVEAEPAFTG